MLSDLCIRTRTRYNPYHLIEKGIILPREYKAEFEAWHVARKAIEKARECAAISEAIRHHLKSRRV